VQLAVPLQEAIIIRGTLKGGTANRTLDVLEFPDAVLATVSFTVNPDCRIHVAANHVCAERASTDTRVALSPVMAENLAVYERLNGRHAVARIGTALPADMVWGHDEDFRFARDLVLSLVRSQVCVPGEPVTRPTEG